MGKLRAIRDIEKYVGGVMGRDVMGISLYNEKV